MGDDRSQFAKRPQFSFAPSNLRHAAARQRPAQGDVETRQEDEYAGPSEANAPLEQEGGRFAANATTHQSVFAVPAHPTTPNPPSKRRRVFHNEAVSPSWPAHSMQGSSSKLFASTPRFSATPRADERPTQASAGAHGLASSTPVNRARFVLPAEPDPDQSSAAPALLPDAFSPHRRKERFVPGGWASQMRTWALDASTQNGTVSSSIHQTSGSSASAMDDEAMTVKVMAVQIADSDGPPVLIRCSVLDANGQAVQQANILLAGPGATGPNPLGSTQAKAEAKIEVGSVMRLQSPMWDIVLHEEAQAEGQSWVVCSRWHVVT